MEDLADGYDRDDPFIDDSECFDEEVPQVCILLFLFGPQTMLIFKYNGRL